MSGGSAAIWFRPRTPAELNAMHAGTMTDRLGIEFTEVGPDFIRGCMPVDARTLQPFGLLHGGASVTMAETLGSVGATLTVDPERMQVVGQEINANHIRSVRRGQVVGTARPVHLGGRSQVWAIEIREERGKLVCVSRLTLAVLDRHAQRLPP